MNKPLQPPGGRSLLEPELLAGMYEMRAWVPDKPQPDRHGCFALAPSYYEDGIVEAVQPFDRFNDGRHWRQYAISNPQAAGSDRYHGAILR